MSNGRTVHGVDLSFLQSMISERDPRPARQQLVGWSPVGGFTLQVDDTLMSSDPPKYPVGRLQLREEQIVVYNDDWVAIIQPDRRFEVAQVT